VHVARNAKRRSEQAFGQPLNMAQLARKEGLTISYEPMVGRIRALRYGSQIILSDQLNGASHDYWLGHAIQHIQNGDGDGCCLASETQE